MRKTDFFFPTVIPTIMTKKLTFTAVLLPLLCMALHAQDKPTANSATPKNMWEIGLHGGHLFVSGDVPYKPGFGGGFHIRKATDYIFSLRADFLGGVAHGEGVGPSYDPDRRFDNVWFSGTGLAVISLNNMRWDKSIRKTNLFVMAGAGVNYFRTEYNNWDSGSEPEPRMPEVRDWQFSPHAALGAGMSFRIGPKANIGIEHTAMMGFGRRADYVDGIELEAGIRTPFRDIVNYTSLRLNFNLGNSSSQSEPLYWLNPLDVVLNDISNIKSQQEAFLQDTDADGVVDALDEAPDTPAGAIVDTKGRVLDSDRDGISDHMDKEPYYTPRQGETVNSEGVVINPVAAGGVTESRVKELIDQALQSYNPSASGAAVAEWFLPMLHFANDSYTIKFSDYGNLAGIARMMKSNPKLRLVVTGFTDQTSTENYNLRLSYLRAKEVVDHLVNNHSIARGRLVIQYKGMEEALVPSASSYLNRRVEFRSAQADDVEMDPPAETKNGDGY
jgi:OOP family OmpA-OmpF porin